MIPWWQGLTVVALLLILVVSQKPKILRHGSRLRHVFHNRVSSCLVTNLTAKYRRPTDTLPLLGNSIRFLQPRHVLLDWFVKQQHYFGTETYEISVPTLPQGVVVNDPETLDFVFKHENVITKGDFVRTRSWDLFGHGIINATGDIWRTQRKAGLKFFTGENLDLMVEEVLADVYTDMQTKLRRAATNKTVIDMQKLFLDLTTTVMGHMAYDMDIDASSPFSKAFDYASDRTTVRFQNPFYRITELFNGRPFRAALEEVRRFGREIVRDARKRRSRAAFDSLVNNEEVVFGSLIDSLLDSFGNLQMVADAALNFLSAGRDTTAQSMTWTLYALMRHPDELERLRDSISPVFSISNTNENIKSSPCNDNHSDHQTKPNSEFDNNASNPTIVSPSITISSLQPTSIPFLHATIYESLRLYPPVPIEIKQTLQSINLPDGTCLPPNAVILWCIWSLNRSTEIYGPDAMSFRPTRWLDSETQKFIPPKSTGEFPVFNGGPRSCLGKKMAEVMIAYVLGRVLVEFDFEEVGDVGEDESRRGHDKNVRKLKERVSQTSLTLPMLGGLPCRVSLR